jgi:hypothetical protein
MPTLDTTYTPDSVSTTTPTSGGGSGYDPLSALMARIVMAKMNRPRETGTGTTYSGSTAAEDRAESNARQDRADARRRAWLAEEAQKKGPIAPITQQYYGISGNPVYSWDLPGMRASAASKG